jgi:AcrR family transcriptional regulator
VKEETAIEQLHAREQVTTDRAHKAQRVRDPEQTLHNLLQAALVVFGRDGYERATVDEIVHVAGCSKGAFYNHFSSKEELFLQLLERRIDGNHERFMEVCQWEGDAPKWLRRVFETIVRFSERDPNWRALSVEFMAHGMRNAEIGQRIATMHQQARQFIAAPLRESEEFRSGRMAVNPDTVAACMVALIDGFLIHASMEPQELPIEQLGQRLQPLLQAWFPGQQRQ